MSFVALSAVALTVGPVYKKHRNSTDQNGVLISVFIFKIILAFDCTIYIPVGNNNQLFKFKLFCIPEFLTRDMLHIIGYYLAIWTTSLTISEIMYKRGPTTTANNGSIYWSARWFRRLCTRSHDFDHNFPVW